MRNGAALLVGIAWLLFAQAAFAAGRDRLPYTGIEASFGKVGFDNASEDADRLDFRASFDFGGPVPIFISASRAEFKADLSQIWSPPASVKSTLSRFDLGLHFGNDSTANFVPSLSVVEARSEFLGNLAFIRPDSETGWAARGAVRALARSWVELGAFMELMFISEDATATVGAEAILYPFRHLGVGVGFETTEGTQTVSARARIVL